MKKSTKFQLIILFILILAAIASGIIFFRSNVIAPEVASQTAPSATTDIQTENPTLPQSTRSSLGNKQVLPAIKETNSSITANQPTTSINLIEKIPAVLFVNDKKYEANIAAGSNIYELMNELSNFTDFKFKAKYYSGMGYFIEEINGVKNNQRQGYNWIYYVNNIKAAVGVSNYLIKSNDIITWKYETTN